MLGQHQEKYVNRCTERAEDAGACEPSLRALRSGWVCPSFRILLRGHRVLSAATRRDAGPKCRRGRVYRVGAQHRVYTRVFLPCVSPCAALKTRGTKPLARRSTVPNALKDGNLRALFRLLNGTLFERQWPLSTPGPRVSDESPRSTCDLCRIVHRFSRRKNLYSETHREASGRR